MFIKIYTLTLFSSLQFHPCQNFQTRDNVDEIEKIHKCLHKRGQQKNKFHFHPKFCKYLWFYSKSISY